MQYEQVFGRTLRSTGKDAPKEGAFAVSIRTNSAARQRMKTFEIREILMEGHLEHEQLTTASTGN